MRLAFDLVTGRSASAYTFAFDGVAIGEEAVLVILLPDREVCFAGVSENGDGS